MEPDDPFRILVIGDFSGRANRGLHSSLGGRRPVLADRDNLDEVLRLMGPSLRISGMTLDFTELDDFHPDSLYRRVPVFRQLSEERARPVAAPQASQPAAPRQRSMDAGAGSLLDELLENEGDRTPPADPAGDLAAFIKHVTAQHTVEREDPRQKQHADKVDSQSAAAMRLLLHHASFQSLEAAWRSLDMLTRRLETGENLKIFAFDATVQELVEDWSGTEKLLTAVPGREWALIIGNYAFAQTATDAAVLHRFGQMASSAGAPFMAEAIPSDGSETMEEWETLRRSPAARWIGLALPRFLLRLPYGRDTSPIESFEFEEMPKSAHQEYLWGNPAFCCAYLLGESFTSDGWEMRPGTHRTISGLPLHAYYSDGETQLKPCAEVLMTEKEAEFLMEQGIMPLASMKRQDSALLVRFQSIAKPVAALGGRWNSTA